MSTLLDFSKFTFSAEQIRDINELVFENILEAPELSFIHTLYPNIVYDKEVGFIGEGGLVGVADQGCSPTPQAWKINTRKVLWQPKAWEVFISECYKDLETTAAVYALNKHTRVIDLTDTDYFAIVVEVLTKAVKKAIYRIVWFNDTDADNTDTEELPKAALTEQEAGSAIVGTVYEKVAATTAGAVKCATEAGVVVYLDGDAATGNAASGKEYYSKDTANPVTILVGGIITENVDTDYFDIIDGLFKQLEAQVTGANLISIASNAKTTKSEQYSDLTPEKAYAILSDMYYALPVVARNGADLRFLVTQSIADKYQQYLVGKGIESTYKNLVDGVPALKFNGIDVIAMPIWDEMIQSFNDLGDTYYKPHRAVLAEKANLAIGFGGEKEFGEMELWYDKNTRKSNILLIDKIDAKLLDNKRVVFAE